MGGWEWGRERKQLRKNRTVLPVQKYIGTQPSLEGKKGGRVAASERGNGRDSLRGRKGGHIEPVIEFGKDEIQGPAHPRLGGEKGRFLEKKKKTPLQERRPVAWKQFLNPCPRPSAEKRRKGEQALRGEEKRGTGRHLLKEGR